WLQRPETVLTSSDDEGGEDVDFVVDDGLAGGTALLELHLQDYLFRNWSRHFPDFTLFEGDRGREFITSDPSVGIIDFLCTDRTGDYVVIETKRNLADRQAVGQILGYMGWVKARLAGD